MPCLIFEVALNGEIEFGKCGTWGTKCGAAKKSRNRSVPQSLLPAPPTDTKSACISQTIMPKTRGRIKRQRICPWCSLSFTKEEHLSRHIRSHTKEKPFGCVTCGKTFSRQFVFPKHFTLKENVSNVALVIRFCDIAEYIPRKTRPTSPLT
jgi:uncharacterized Zn-finger protein